MAVFHGKQGSASFTNLVFEMSSFTIDATADTADSSVMSSATVAAATHWKDYVAGFKDWTASVECLEPTTGGGIAALGTEAILILDTTAGLAYGGSAACTGYGPSVSSDDAARLTLTFQGTGQLLAT